MTPDTIEPSAFGTDFEAALMSAYAEAGINAEPGAAPVAPAALATPKEPDAPAEPAAPAAPEPVAPEPVKPAEPAKLPESLDDILLEPEDRDVELPVDEPAEDPAETKGMTDIAATRFRELRQERKELAKALATRETELAQKAARVAELEALAANAEANAAKLAEYEMKIAAVRLEESDAYKQTVTAPLASIASEAEAIAKKHGISNTELLDALAESDTDRQDTLLEDLLAGVGDRDKMKVYKLAESLPSVLEARDKLLNNRTEALAELDARAAAEKQAAALDFAKTRKAAATLVDTRVQARIPFLKDAEKFSLSEIRDKTAETDFDSLDVTTKAYNVYSGRLVPQLARAYDAALREIETLTDEITKYKESSPAIRGAAAQATGAGADRSFVDAIEAAFSGAGV